MIRFFAGHPTAANLLMLVLLAMGLLAVPSLRRATFPDFVSPKVEVRTIYPGATAEDVEEAVCRRIETALESVEQVEEVVSEARENVGIVTLEMAEGGDMTLFLSDVKTEVDAIDDFPDEVEDPIVKSIQRTDMVVSIAVAGDLPITDLKGYCEALKERLLRDPEVSLVTVTGFSQRQIRIEVPSTTLMQYGVSADELSRVVGSQSFDLPVGTLRAEDREVVLRFTEERRSVEEFEDLVVVSGESGGEIRLGDIATITDVFEPEEVRITYDGLPAGVLMVEKTKSQDVLTVYDAVAAFVERERASAPRGMSVELTSDTSSVVRDRLTMLLKNGWQGLLLVLGVMWLFFGLRYSFWVALGLPVAFLGAFFFMPFLGLNIDMLTMVALLMALGLMMDDAIVLAESIATELEGDASALDAVVNGVQKVRIGVFSSFITTCSVFVPLAFLKGDIGAVLLVVPLTLLLVLAVSLVEAFFILPHHLKGSVANTRGKPPSRFRRAFDGGFETVREKVVGRVVDVAVRWRYVTVAGVTSVFLVSFGLLAGGHVKFQAFPDLEGDVAICRLLLPQGTPLSRTEEVVGRITDALEDVASEVGRPGTPLVRSVTVTYNQNADAQEEGPHVATISADLATTEERDVSLDALFALWRERIGKVPDVLSLAFTEPGLGPAGRPIEIRISGDDLDVLAEESRRVQGWLGRFRGVEDLMDDLRPGKPEFRVEMLPGARVLGFSASDIARQMRSAFYGSTAAEVQVGTESYEIDVRLALQDRSSLANVDQFHVTSPQGVQVPLGTVATVVPNRGYARIARIDRRRTVTVIGDVDTRYANTSQVMQQFQREVVPDLRERGLGVAIEGEIEQGQKTAGSMVRALMIGMLGIFILLSFQFRSFLEPVTVMTAIPMALIGVIWGHRAMGLPLTMPSIMGFASLAGVVVNDSILLVEFIKRRRRDGMATEDAACTASRDRFRAVLITSLTTVAGLTPLLTETSLQAQVLIPLAASIVFGILASTLLVLFVVPSIYAILGDLGLLAKEHE
ncbi:MAG: efflux RND transporter permease subunit [Planctomycetota bacterium]